MKLNKSMDFLLENAGVVIQYRLHKEILKDLSAAEDENLLEKVMQTRLQDGEAAARMLSYYAIPKEAPIIQNYITAMRDDAIVESEFQFYPPAFEQFATRYDGVKNGTSMMVIFYAMQAMLGYGDDEYVLPFQSTSLEAFKEILHVNHVSNFAKCNEKLIKRYKTPYYVEQDTFVPCAYHLATLAYTNAWRTKDNIDMLAKSINHICNAKLMENANGLLAKYKNKYGGSLWMLLYPLSPFKIDTIQGVMYRRVLTEIAMLGLGDKVDIIKESMKNLKETLPDDGVLKWEITSVYQKSQFRAQKWPTAYCDIWLEDDHKKKTALECDLTFWAVQLLHILGEADF